MRVLFLIPDLRRGLVARGRIWLAQRGLDPRFDWEAELWTSEIFGGTMNIMRHCALARALGIDAALATESGDDTYGTRAVAQLPYVAWGHRRRDDVCVVPDIFSRLANEVDGAVIVYEQNPNLVRRNFDYLRPDLELWGCSPSMTECCAAVFPGKVARLAPVIVDAAMFPFIPPERRQPGRLAALPRKNGKPFIEATYQRYCEDGGRYWKLDLIDGLPFDEYAARFRLPQALLPATDVEGCGLPGMEAMAGGMVVSGKNAQGASFYMRDGETALVANTPESAAAALRAIEDPQLRQRLARAGYEYIRPYFTDAEPKRFWQDLRAELQRCAR